MHISCIYVAYNFAYILRIICVCFDNNFSNEIEVVVGEGWINGVWYAGNLSYHLENRPIFKYQYKNDNRVGNIRVDSLNNIKNCKGIFLKVEPYYESCLNGLKK